MSIEDDINEYIGYLAEQIESIAHIEFRLFRKILQAAVIDTLSRAACPDVRGHRERVVRFIDLCSGWQYKDRVSAPQLLLVLEQNQRTGNKLYEEMQRLVNSYLWGRWGVPTPEDDATYQAVCDFAASDEEKFIKETRYAELFYTYRNNLVHEFREPGYAMEIRDDPSPYYLNVQGQGWQLVFPAPFFDALCKGCLTGLGNHLRVEKRNPYDSYKFGSLWRRT